MRVAVDSGHGREKTGKWNGASGNDIIEDVLVLDFAKRLGHYCRARGAQTVFTRETENIVTLGSRGQKAVRARADLFISIHANAFSQTSANGAEVFVVAGDMPSERIAQSVLAAVCGVGHNGRFLHSRGVKADSSGQHKSLRVLRDTYRSMPAMLLELGFLSNPGDAEMLKSARWRESVACVVAGALVPDD